MTTNFDRANWGRVSMIDSRQRDDEGRVIPGSGEIIPCACCGRGIEVHVEIANADTRERATIGKACANRMGLIHISLITSYGERYEKWNS